MFKIRRDYLIDTIVLSLIIALFYNVWLAHYPLFTPDEARYSEVAREMITTHDYITPRLNGLVFMDKPILHYWLQVIAIKLFGLREWSVRFFPMGLGLIGCLITYVCGRQLFNRHTALLASIVLMTSPLYFGGTHYANLDLEVAVFISSSLLCYICAFQSKTNQAVYFLYLAAIFTALSCLTKGLIGLLFPLIICGPFLFIVKPTLAFSKKQALIALFIFLSLVLPWYLLMQHANSHFFYYFFVIQHFVRFTAKADFNNQTPSWFYLPILMIGFFPWIIFLAQAISFAFKKIWQHRPQQVLLFLFIWFFVIFVFFSIPRSKIITYILPIFPALSLLVGHYLATFWHEQNIKIRLLYALANLCMAIWLLLLYFKPFINLSPHFAPLLIIISFIFFIAALISLFLKTAKINQLFCLCVMTNYLFLLTLTKGANQLNINSAKPIIKTLQPILKPSDQVIFYFKYFYDVPLYLQQTATIISDWQPTSTQIKDNWLRELTYGLMVRPNQLWNEQKFWKKWGSEQRLYVFVNENYLEQFKLNPYPIFLVAKHQKIYLFTNHREGAFLKTQVLLNKKVKMGKMSSIKIRAI